MLYPGTFNDKLILLSTTSGVMCWPRVWQIMRFDYWSGQTKDF